MEHSLLDPILSQTNSVRTIQRFWKYHQLDLLEPFCWLCSTQNSFSANFLVRSNYYFEDCFRLSFSLSWLALIVILPWTIPPAQHDLRKPQVPVTWPHYLLASRAGSSTFWSVLRILLSCCPASVQPSDWHFPHVKRPGKCLNYNRLESLIHRSYKNKHWQTITKYTISKFNHYQTYPSWNKN
jgi:hypothetical protein